MFLGLEHAAIASPDPKHLADWYVQHLGFHINFEQAGNFIVKAPNGSLIEIIHSEGTSPKPKFRDPGIRHFAIAVDDFDAAHEALKRDAVQFLGEPFENQGNRLVFFEDADGNILHLIQRVTPLP
ncbi:MAG TPA: VOC family protein [Bryobacteraceae bacterium]|nr:VOC family protein [Bryobacteraceae bacterium]